MDKNENLFNEYPIDSLFTVTNPNGIVSVYTPADYATPLMAGDAVLDSHTDYLNYVPTEKTEEVV